MIRFIEGWISILIALKDWIYLLKLEKCFVDNNRLRIFWFRLSTFNEADNYIEYDENYEEFVLKYD